MHALRSTLSSVKNHAIPAPKELHPSGPSNAPMMKSLIRPRNTGIGRWHQRATYYYDASWHTGKTFRQLIKSLDESDNTSGYNLGSCSNSQLLLDQTEFFLNSLQPFVNGVADSKAKYIALLQMHLSAIEQPDRAKLSGHLRQQGYDCEIIESTIDDSMYKEYGFCNGPPHTHKTILLSAHEFFKLLENPYSLDPCEPCSIFNAPDISAKQAQTIRNQLSSSTSDWLDSDKSLASFLRIACRLESVVTGDISIASVVTYNDEPGPSKILQQHNQLLIDLLCVHELKNQPSESLFAVLLRDMLEIFLAKKIVGPLANITELSAIQRRRIWSAIEKISALAPEASQLTAFHSHVKNLLSSSQHFGKINIIPPSGVALGHAWVTPTLSVIPDQQKLGVPMGTCYLHSGARLKAGISIINEWPIHWLSASESETLYPAKRAWLQPVPVPAHQLELAAHQLREEWTRASLPYRFVSVGPESPATGCRISVWHAIEKGMDDNTKLLFDMFNRGLPLPDSTIELWERLHGFMHWLELLAGDHRSHAL